ASVMSASSGSNRWAITPCCCGSPMAMPAASIPGARCTQWVATTTTAGPSTSRRWRPQACRGSGRLPRMSGDATQLLHAWRGGDLAARDLLVGLLYQEHHGLADRQFGRERREHTLQPTALVSEAYQRLAGIDRIEWQDRAHFIGVAARLVREILIDHARRR